MNTFEVTRRASVPSPLTTALRRGMTDLPAVLLHKNLIYYNNNNTTTTANNRSNITNSTTTTSISRSTPLLAFLIVLASSFVVFPILFVFCRYCYERRHQAFLRQTTTAAAASIIAQHTTATAATTSTATLHNHAPSSRTSSTPSQQHRQLPERHGNNAHHHHHHLSMELVSRSLDRQKIKHKLLISRFFQRQQQQQDDDNNDSLHDGKKETGGYKECSICLGSFHFGEEVAQSVNQDCCHMFHAECIINWLMIHANCPQCRRDFFPVSNNNSNNDPQAMLEP